MAETRYFTFEETLQKLNLTEEQLLDMVAANELRAFVKGGDMHFRSSDIASTEGGEDAAVAADADVIELVEDAGGQSQEEEVVLLDEESLADGSESEEEIVLLDDEDATSPPEAETLLADDAMSLEEAPALPEESDDEDAIDLEFTPESGTGSNLGAIGGLSFDDFEQEDDEVLLEEEGATLILDEIEDEPAESATEPTLVMEDIEGVGLGTEEIVFEDDDLADLDGTSATQEVTVQEDAVGYDDDASLTVVEDAVDATEVLDGDDLAVDFEHEGGDGGGEDEDGAQIVYAEPPVPPASPIWAVVMAACVLISLVPVGVLMSSIAKGVAMHNPGDLTKIEHGGRLPTRGAPFVPGVLKELIKATEAGKFWGQTKIDTNAKITRYDPIADDVIAEQPIAEEAVTEDTGEGVDESGADVEEGTDEGATDEGGMAAEGAGDIADAAGKVADDVKAFGGEGEAAAEGDAEDAEQAPAQTETENKDGGGFGDW